jgi:hypothetical protein
MTGWLRRAAAGMLRLLFDGLRGGNRAPAGWAIEIP